MTIQGSGLRDLGYQGLRFQYDNSKKTGEAPFNNLVAVVTLLIITDNPAYKYP